MASAKAGSSRAGIRSRGPWLGMVQHERFKADTLEVEALAGIGALQPAKASTSKHGDWQATLNLALESICITMQARRPTVVVRQGFRIGNLTLRCWEPNGSLLAWEKWPESLPGVRSDNPQSVHPELENTGVPHVIVVVARSQQSTVRKADPNHSRCTRAVGCMLLQGGREDASMV
jgi:hypothetical protein